MQAIAFSCLPRVLGRQTCEGRRDKRDRFGTVICGWTVLGGAFSIEAKAAAVP